MQKGMRKHRSSLKTKVAVIMLLFTVLLSVGTVIISYTTYTESFNRHYESLATSITKTAASVINAKDAATLTQEVKKYITRYVPKTAGFPALTTSPKPKRKRITPALHIYRKCRNTKAFWIS